MTAPIKAKQAMALRICLAITGCFGGWTLTFANPTFRHSTTLDLAGRFLPLQFWGALLFLYAVLLITDFGDLGRIIGYALGAGIVAYFAVSYGWTIFHPSRGKGRNGLALSLMVDVVIFHVSAIRVTIERKIGQTK